jgi:hypothetical protein
MVTFTGISYGEVARRELRQDRIVYAGLIAMILIVALVTLRLIAR